MLAGHLIVSHIHCHGRPLAGRRSDLDFFIEGFLELPRLLHSLLCSVANSQVLCERLWFAQHPHHRLTYRRRSAELLLF